MVTRESSTSPFRAPKPTHVLIVLLVIGAVLRVHSFGGLWGTDDSEYTRLAHAISTDSYNDFIQHNYIDDPDTPAQWPGRIGNYYPMSLMFRVLGVGEVARVAYPLFVSMLGIILACLCGRLLFGVRAGLIAAAIWVFLPLDIDYATAPLPDIPASFLASLGVAVVLNRLYAASPWLARPLVAGGVAGLCFGASWLTKESIAYLVPLVAVLMFISIRRDPRAQAPFWIGVALASLTVLIGEMVVYQLWRGDFLLRMHENERGYVQARTYLFYEGSRFGWPEGGSRLAALIKRLFVSGPETIFLGTHQLFLPSFGVLASRYALYWRDRTFAIPALWMFSLVVAYNFATSSLSSYTPLVLSNTRYLHPIMLPATLLAAGLIAKLLADDRGDNQLLAKERFVWGMTVASLIGCMAVYTTFRAIRDQPAREALFETERVAEIVRPADVLYTDPLTAKVLEFHWGYPERMSVEDFEEMSPADIRPGGFVLLDKTRVNWLRINVGSYWLTRRYVYNGPRFDRIPADWEAVWHNSNATLYRVGAPTP